MALSPKFIEQIELQALVNAQQHEAALLEGHVESPRPSAVDLDLLGVVYSGKTMLFLSLLECTTDVDNDADW